ncbi:MAG TPA: hypothetical protein VMW87_03790 [Spirochaetia bacterium]|nr:hypothetical protein [Spirochaetia bacterium]
MSDSPDITELWKRKVLDPKNALRYDLGPVAIWVCFEDHDWYVAHERREDGVLGYRVTHFPLRDAPEDLKWRRWTAAKESLEVSVTPHLPDRPLVVKPESEIKIPAGNRALFFVSIPLWFRVTVGQPQPILLTEIPSVVLSNSWFGDVTSGELCYSLRTKATRDVDLSEVVLHRATCPMHIHNNSPTELDFQRLCVHAEFLRLYEGQNRLYTNHVKVVFRGDEHLSQIELSKEAPDIEPNCRLVQHARMQAEQSLMRKTFQVLRSLTGV